MAVRAPLPALTHLSIGTDPPRPRGNRYFATIEDEHDSTPASFIDNFDVMSLVFNELRKSMADREYSDCVSFQNMLWTLSPVSKEFKETFAYTSAEFVRDLKLREIYTNANGEEAANDDAVAIMKWWCESTRILWDTQLQQQLSLVDRERLVTIVWDEMVANRDTLLRHVPTIKMMFGVDPAIVELVEDPAVMIELLSDDTLMTPAVLSNASSAMRANEKVVLAAIAHYPIAFASADETLTERKSFVLKAVAIEGSLLDLCMDDFKRDYDIVLEAVSNSGMSLYWADDTLRQEKAIVRAAIRDDPKAFRYASPALQKDEDLALLAVSELANKGLLAHKEVFHSIRHLFWKSEATPNSNVLFKALETGLTPNRNFLFRVLETGFNVDHARLVKEKDELEKLWLGLAKEDDLAFYEVEVWAARAGAVANAHIDLLGLNKDVFQNMLALISALASEYYASV